MQQAPQPGRHSMVLTPPPRARTRPEPRPGAAPCGWRGRRTSAPGCRRRSPGRPAVPPSGPRSMTQSARAMTSRLCSMTITELPSSTSRLRMRHQPRDVGEVQPGGRLVQDVELARLPSSAASLRRWHLAAGQGRERLAEREVVRGPTSHSRPARLDAPLARRARRASCAVMPEHSWMFCPASAAPAPRRCSGGPSQSAQATSTSSRKCISTAMAPWPLHVGAGALGVEAEQGGRLAGGAREHLRGSSSNTPG